MLLGTKIVAARPNRHCVKIRKRVLTILVSTLFYICTTNIEPQGSLRGRGPFVFEGVQRKPFRKVSSGFFYGSLEPVFSFEEKTGSRKRSKLAGTARKILALAATAKMKRQPGMQCLKKGPAFRQVLLGF